MNDKCKSQAVSSNRPLVSILYICRNASATVRRCIDSFLCQDYPYVEVIVQDCSSADGTVDILQSYGHRIYLILAQDREPGDGMFKVIQGSKGKVFIICRAEEELLPSAVTWGVEQLNHHPEAGAVYGDRYITDMEGTITGIEKNSQWNYNRLLCSEIVPPLCTSFIRRAAYDSIGPTYNADFSEFEMWIRLGLRFPVVYVPGQVSKTSVNNKQTSMQIEALDAQIARRFRALERFFSRRDLPAGFQKKKDDILASMYTWIVNRYCNAMLWEQACSAYHVAYAKDSNKERLHHAGMRLLNHGLGLIKEGRIPDARDFIELPLRMPSAFMHIDLSPVRKIYDHFYPVYNNANCPNQ